MHACRKMSLCALAMLPAALAWAQNAGLSADAEDLPWARWQTRLTIAVAAPLWRSSSEPTAAYRGGPKLDSASLMGDFYFLRDLGTDGRALGLRATSGIVLGSRGALWAGVPAGAAAGGLFSVDRRLFGAAPPLPARLDSATDGTTLPYVGLGYSGLTGRGGWSLSADFGVLARAPGNAVKLGRVFTGGQGLDDLLRDMRLAPVLQLGASYSF